MTKYLFTVIAFLFFICFDCSVNEIYADDSKDVLPLDAWILNKKPSSESSKKKKTLEEAEDKDKDKDDDKNENTNPMLLEEERRVYKALLESSYEEESDNSKKDERPTSDKIFQKVVLGRLEQARLEKAKKIQRLIQRRQTQYIESRLKKESTPLRVRLCLVDFSVLGFPSDVIRVSKIPTKIITKTWRSSMKEIVTRNCSLVLFTGLVSRTKTRGGEFIEKTISYLDPEGVDSWKYKISSTYGAGFFSLIYKSNVFLLKDFKELEGTMLRKGGEFIEDHFISSPMEVLIEDKRADSPENFRLFLFDFRDFRKIDLEPSLSHYLQMASALNELNQKRSQEYTDDHLLMLGSWNLLKYKVPFLQIFTGRLTLKDFIGEGPCTLFDEEKDGEYYSCNDENIRPEHKNIFGFISDLVRFHPEIPQKELNKILLAKSQLNSDIFIMERSLNIAPIFKHGNDQHYSTGFRSIGTKKYPATFIWADIETQEKNN